MTAVRTAMRTTIPRLYKDLAPVQVAASTLQSITKQSGRFPEVSGRVGSWDVGDDASCHREQAWVSRVGEVSEKLRRGVGAVICRACSRGRFG